MWFHDGCFGTWFSIKFQGLFIHLKNFLRKIFLTWTIRRDTLRNMQKKALQNTVLPDQVWKKIKFQMENISATVSDSSLEHFLEEKIASLGFEFSWRSVKRMHSSQSLPNSLWKSIVHRIWRSRRPQNNACIFVTHLSYLWGDSMQRLQNVMFVDNQHSCFNFFLQDLQFPSNLHVRSHGSDSTTKLCSWWTHINCRRVILQININHHVEM